MTDTDKKPDPSLCPHESKGCVLKDQLLVLEKRFADLVQQVKLMDTGGTKAMARLVDQITADSRSRVGMLTELVDGMRRLNAWAPGIDQHHEGLALRLGEVAQKVEHIRDEVRELQGAFESGNGHDRKNGK